MCTPPLDFFSFPQPAPDRFDLSSRRRAPALRLLLKGVEHVHSSLKLHRIHSPKRIAALIGDNLQHASAAETAQRLGIPVLPAALRDI
jgi:hypothetical protein